jgi:hypothetical protein
MRRGHYPTDDAFEVFGGDGATFIVGQRQREEHLRDCPWSRKSGIVTLLGCMCSTKL